MRVLVRAAQLPDCGRLAQMAFALWPESSIEEHAQELKDRLADGTPGTLPLIYFVAEVQPNGLIGFLEAGLRSHADCCDPAHPVGFIEGWYVEPEFRRRGIGRSLVAAAENWARSQGCKEMASDTGIENEASQQSHEALGYQPVSRSVNFRKRL
jgi:aminoglycoside 6'-N-acetyltransferase I